MPEGKTINKIYWIVHPAFTLGVPHNVPNDEKCRNNASFIKEYFESKLVPLIEKAKKEPDSLVILVKSPAMSDFLLQLRKQNLQPSKEDLSRFRRNNKVSRSREKRMILLENSLGDFLAQALKNRAIVFPDMQTREDVAKNLKLLIAERRFVLARNVKMPSRGSLFEYCVKSFPKTFKINEQQNARVIPIRSESISLRETTNRRKLARLLHRRL